MKVTNAKFTLLLCFLFVVFFGCGGGGGDGGGPPPPTSHPRAPILLGYSLPNAWHLVDPRDFAAALASNGLTATEIEWMPFRNAPKVCPGRATGGISAAEGVNGTNASFPQAAQAFIAVMCAQNVTTVVNVVNANSCAQAPQNDQWFNGKLAEVLAHADPTCIILSPVAEPWQADAGKMKRWTQIVRRQWSTRFMAPADRGGAVPFWRDIPFDFIDSHPCSHPRVEALLNTGNGAVITNTDCSPTLNPGPVVAAQWARRALDHGAPLLIYDFAATQYDLATLQAMGAEIK